MKVVTSNEMSDIFAPGGDPESSGARRLEFPANYASLDSVREFVGEVAEENGFSPKLVYGVQMAVDEAFTNIIEHAYGGESDEVVECRVWCKQGKLTVILRDCGEPFNPMEVPDPDLDADLEERDVGGLGLFFMRNLMDEVHFEFGMDPGLGKRCNTLTMIKHKEKPA